MAKLTKEEVQALLRVMGASTYHTRKSREVTSEFGDEVKNWGFVTHKVDIWYGRHTTDRNVYLTTRASAWSRYEDRAWHIAYIRFIKLVENDG